MKIKLSKKQFENLKQNFVEVLHDINYERFQNGEPILEILDSTEELCASFGTLIMTLGEEITDQDGESIVGEKTVKAFEFLKLLINLEEELEANN